MGIPVLMIAFTQSFAHLCNLISLTLDQPPKWTWWLILSRCASYSILWRVKEKVSKLQWLIFNPCIGLFVKIYCHWLFQKKFLSTTSQDSGGGKSYVLFSTSTSPHRSTPLPNPHPTMSCNVEYNNTRTNNQTTHSKNISPPHHLYCGHSLLPTKGSTTEGKTRSRPGKGNWSNWPLSILKTWSHTTRWCPALRSPDKWRRGARRRRRWRRERRRQKSQQRCHPGCPAPAPGRKLQIEL